MRTFYDILGVGAAASFEEIKAAYYRKAKQCHPDLFGGDLDKTTEFQILVNAFDVLSDPNTRREYDERRTFGHAPHSKVSSNSFHVDGHRVMDTIADDILEELIVGNNIPRNTTLQHLMLDLTHTERFVMFREAKTFFAQGRVGVCLAMCSRLVEASPHNILYHYFLAESCRLSGKLSRAAKHYRICLEIGLMRTPPQRLDLIRARYRQVQGRRGLLGKMMSWFASPEVSIELSEEEKSRQVLDSVFSSELKRLGKSSKVDKSNRYLR